MSEEWRQIPGWEGLYEVSDLGNVRSLDRTIYAHFGPLGEYTGRTWKGKQLKPTFDDKGYPYVTLCRGSKDRTRIAVHSLVMRAFVGPLPDGLETRHLNGINSDPRLVNLTYGTALENAQDNILHGKNQCLKKTHCPKGHPLHGDNLYLRSNGWRDCRACRDAASKRYKAKAKGIAAKVVAASFIMVAAGAAIASLAKADPIEPQVFNYAVTAAPAICAVLDKYPTLPGVEGVLQGIENDSGFTAFQAGEALAIGVQAQCPRHIALLQRFADTYAPQSTSGGVLA